MKKIILSLAFIIVVLISFGQTKSYYKISGKIRDINTLQMLRDCHVKLVSSTGIVLEVKSNKKGDYIIDSLSSDNKYIYIEVTKKRYLTNNENRKSILFDSIPHDTIINFKITPIPLSGDFFPEIYFKYNSDIPDSSYQYCLNDIESLMQGFYHQKLVIVGYKDSLETIDKRKERAEFVYNLLIKKGIDKNKLTIDTVVNQILANIFTLY